MYEFENYPANSNEFIFYLLIRTILYLKFFIFAIMNCLEIEQLVTAKKLGN